MRICISASTINIYIYIFLYHVHFFTIKHPTSLMTISVCPIVILSNLLLETIRPLRVKSIKVPETMKNCRLFKLIQLCEKKKKIGPPIHLVSFQSSNTFTLFSFSRMTLRHVQRMGKQRISFSRRIEIQNTLKTRRIDFFFSILSNLNTIVV